MYVRGCGAIYECRVLSGPKSPKTNGLPSPAAINISSNRDATSEAPFVIRASILVGLILCVSSCGQLCCDSQQILFHKTPAMHTLRLLCYFHTSSTVISQAFQECSVHNNVSGKLEEQGGDRKEICMAGGDAARRSFYTFS